MNKTLAEGVKSPMTGGRVFLIEDTEKMAFRGEHYNIHVRYYICEDTGEQFTTTGQDTLAFNELYNEYRVRHGIPFPDEIRRTREHYGLSCAQITRIVGFGQNQWRQYENGQVPSESNARSIVAAADKAAFLRMVEASRAELGEKEYNIIRSKIISAPEQADDFAKSFYFYGSTRRSIYNGYAPKSPNKLSAMVLWMIARMPQGVVKTKLNKMMFYADMLHYRRYGIAISGLQYRAIQYGPVPVHYDTVYDNIDGIEKETVETNDREYSLLKAAEPDTSCLSEDEMSTIREVAGRLVPMSRGEVVELTHKETAWQKYKEQHGLIPYSEAFNLVAF